MIRPRSWASSIWNNHRKCFPKTTGFWFAPWRFRLVIAHHTIRLYEEVSRWEKPIQALREVADRIRDFRLDPDVIIRLVLTGVTAGEGLGFSRAFVLFLSPDQTVFEGRLAIGSVDGDAAPSRAFATVPLRAANKTLGVIVADRSFMNSENGIREGDLRFLEAFADLAVCCDPELKGTRRTRRHR